MHLSDKSEEIFPIFLLYIWIFKKKKSKLFIVADLLLINRFPEPLLTFIYFFYISNLKKLSHQFFFCFYYQRWIFLFFVYSLRNFCLDNLKSPFKLWIILVILNKYFFQRFGFLLQNSPFDEYPAVFFIQASNLLFIL